MRHSPSLCALFATLATLACHKDPTDPRPLAESSPAGVTVARLHVSSSAFAAGAAIPSPYTCDGEDRSPELSWSEPPAGTQSLVLIVDDPDAPDPAAPKTVYAHWLLFNLAPERRSLAENEHLASAIGAGARDGKNDFGRAGYGGPCPPVGTHRYFHKLYALDRPLDGLRDPNKAQLEKAMRGHVLGYGELVGTYQKRAP